MASIPSHSRKPSSRAALPRRTTRGPLDAPEDPLAVSGTSTASSLQPAKAPTTSQSEKQDPIAPAVSSSELRPRQEPTAAPEPTPTEDRELSFLLDASTYHAISQVDVPTPFRKPFLPPPGPDVPLNPLLLQLEGLLSQCDFVRAAQLTGSILISGGIRSNDAKTIFRLLQIRYSCLELSGNLLMAAQEAKALEDLSSGFYYDDLHPDKMSEDEATEGQPRKVPTHIMPFSLRLQALRLQSVGFSDPRRGVSSLYDVALECREHLSSPMTGPEQRRLWTERLEEVSLRVVNSLIEMGDLESATRSLEGLKPAQGKDLAVWTSRMILLRMKMGDIAGVDRLVETLDIDVPERPLLESLSAIAHGHFEKASKILSQDTASSNPATEALVKQNLAVAYLYRGEIIKARDLLEELVVAGHSFQNLTVNLATIYDLTSDKSRELKASMVSRIASSRPDRTQIRSYVNADFKL